MNNALKYIKHNVMKLLGNEKHRSKPSGSEAGQRVLSLDTESMSH